MRVAAMLLLVAVTGCAQRQAPYRFRGPGVSGVTIGESRLPVADYRSHTTNRTPRSEPAPLMPASPPPLAGEGQGGGSPLASELRALVGQRMRQAGQLDFVRAALAAIHAPIAAELRRAAEVEELLAAAEARGALEVDGPPLLGDLLVFDDVAPGDRGTLLGVAVAVDDRGVVEFVYLARGVVRRGFMHRARATDKRDAGGRTVNTILRQEHGGRNKGLGDLAGQLHSAYVRLERLLAP